MKLSLATFALSAAVVAAAPAGELSKRDSCGQWDTISASPYTLYVDGWNIGAGSGWGCIGLDYQSGSTISWHTAWSWSGGSNQVKEYPNVVLTDYTPKKVSSISSIPSIWKWSYTGTNVVADVAYDIFTSSSSSGSAEYEIMIWLAAYGGAGPISSTGSPIATPTIAGTSWKLYKGPNGSTTVFSFVASSAVTSFNGDLLGFFSYLVSSQGYSNSQYVQTIGAGTEPFTGTSAQLTTTQYSLAIN